MMLRVCRLAKAQAKENRMPVQSSVKLSRLSKFFFDQLTVPLIMT